jgi:hypothetical protein
VLQEVAGRTADVLKPMLSQVDAKAIARGEIMDDPRHQQFRLWPWRRQTATTTTLNTPPSAPELTAKLIELIHFERGVAALYYYLPDASLAALAQDICESRRGANELNQGVDRELRAKDATLEGWTAIGAIWHSTVWQPGEILATFGFRLIEALRAESELWSVVVDPRAQFFGLAVTTDETQRYWWVLVAGQKGQEADSGATTAAR